MNELISIIIPVYNVERYLEKCLNSVLEQTYQNIEIILVNDGSTDNSLKICEGYSEKDKRVHIVQQRNAGLSAARNVGIKNAKGKYFMFIDSDDWIDKNMVKSLYNSLKKFNVKLACCGKVVYESENTFYKRGLLEDQILDIKDIIRLSAFDKDVGIAAWGKMYDREIFNNLKFPEGEIHEDVAIMYRIFDKCQRVFVLGNSYYYYYRFNGTGISKSEYSNKFDIVLKHDLENEKFIIDKYADLKDIMMAITANSCINTQLKILKTTNGYIKFKNQYDIYKSVLKERLKCYLKQKDISLKRGIWLIIILCTNSITYKLYKLIRYC